MGSAQNEWARVVAEWVPRGSPLPVLVPREWQWYVSGYSNGKSQEKAQEKRLSRLNMLCIAKIREKEYGVDVGQSQKSTLIESTVVGLIVIGFEGQFAEFIG